MSSIALTPLDSQSITYLFSQNCHILLEKLSAPFFPMLKAKQTRLRLERKLALWDDVSTLCNPSFGVDRSIGMVMERLRNFHQSDFCWLVSFDTLDGNFYSRRVDNPNCEGMTKKSPLAASLGQKILDFPNSVALIGNRAGSRFGSFSDYSAGKTAVEGYDLNSHCSVALSSTNCTALSAIIEGNFVGIPLVHQGQVLGRLFLVSKEHKFTRDDVDLLYQVLRQVVMVIKNMQLIDRLVSHAGNEERLRIARDLHDSIVQPYIGLQMGIESLRRKAEAQGYLLQEIEQLGQLCKAGTEELRGYVRGLRDERAGEENLLGAVRRFVAKFELATGIPVKIETVDEINLHPQLSAEVLQFVSEGLSNIRRHTDAELATLRFQRECTFFQLQIENRFFVTSNKSIAPSIDELHPFTPTSLLERANSLGGTIAVKVFDWGSTVTITIPL